MAPFVDLKIKGACGVCVIIRELLLLENHGRGVFGRYFVFDELRSRSQGCDVGEDA